MLKGNCAQSKIPFDQLLIHQITKDDLKALEWNGALIHYRRLYQDIYESSLEQKTLMWGVKLQENLIGQLFVQLRSNNPYFADGVNRAYLFGFRIKPEYRNLGIGSKLLVNAENDLKRKAFRVINLHVARDNHAALRFYERHNYQIIAMVAGRWSYLDHLGRLQKVDEPSWRMEKALKSISIS